MPMIAVQGEPSPMSSMYSEGSSDETTNSVASPTFLDDITLGDDAELAGWVASQDFVKELLELGEESLEFSAAEDELRKLQTRLNDAESRESELKQVVSSKEERISELENMVAQLEREAMEERARAKDEAEDMAQEMAELRFQMTEMLEEERQIRAHTEKVSVQRVEELELQVRQAREEVVEALTRRQESESRAEKEILNLRLALQQAQQQLEESTPVQECKQCAVLLEEISQVKAELSSMEFGGGEAGDENPQQTGAEGEEMIECSATEEVLQVSTVENTQTEEGSISANTDVEEGSESSAQENEVVECVVAGGEQIEPTEKCEELQQIEPTEECEELQHRCRQCFALSEEITRLKAELSEVVTSSLITAEAEVETTSEMEEEATAVHETEDQARSVEAGTTAVEHSDELDSEQVRLSKKVTRLQEIVEVKINEFQEVNDELALCRDNLDTQHELVEGLSKRIKEFEAELEVERGCHSDSVLKCNGLSDSLEETTRRLSTAEAELELCKNKNEVLQRGIEMAESQLSESIKEKVVLQQDLEQLRSLVEAHERSLLREQQELVSQRTINGQLARRIGELNSEVLILQQQLITCQTQVSEMAMKNVILEDTVLSKKRKIKEGEEVISEQAAKLARQEEVYFNLQAKFSALQNDFSTLEAKLGETRRKEQEARMQMERLSIELTMAKEEVVKSEVRLQKSVKQAKEQADAGKRKLDDIVSRHKYTERQLRKAEADLKSL